MSHFEDNLKKLLNRVPQLPELAPNWVPLAVPEDIPFSEHDRQALMILRMLTRNMLEPGKTFTPSERFELEIKYLAGNSAIYSGRAMADYVMQLEFPQLENRPGVYTGYLDFKIRYKNKRLAEEVRMFCANHDKFLIHNNFLTT